MKRVLLFAAILLSVFSIEASKEASKRSRKKVLSTEVSPAATPGYLRTAYYKVKRDPLASMLAATKDGHLKYLAEKNLKGWKQYANLGLQQASKKVSDVNYQGTLAHMQENQSKSITAQQDMMNVLLACLNVSRNNPEFIINEKTMTKVVESAKETHKHSIQTLIEALLNARKTRKSLNEFVTIARKLYPAMAEYRSKVTPQASVVEFLKQKKEIEKKAELEKLAEAEKAELAKIAKAALPKTTEETRLTEAAVAAVGKALQLEK